EMEKLLSRGQGWLAGHPLREEITRRYLRFKPSLYRQALARLVEQEEPDAEDTSAREPAEVVLERPMSLNEQRLGAVVAVLRASGARRMLDLGCGEGKLLRELMEDRRFTDLVGVDVSIRALEVANRRLKLDRSTSRTEGVRLLHGSLTYRDKRL